MGFFSRRVFRGGVGQGRSMSMWIPCEARSGERVAGRQSAPTGRTG